MLVACRHLENKTLRPDKHLVWRKGRDKNHGNKYKKNSSQNDPIWTLRIHIKKQQW